jgi:hypothetical protein
VQTLTTLVSFNGADGANPRAALIADAAADHYGTKEAGGANSRGTVFKIAKTAGGYANTPPRSSASTSPTGMVHLPG